MNNEQYWGEVVDVNDAKKSSRVKVSVLTLFDSIETENIPWAMPRYIDASSHDLPALGDIVYVKFMNNDINFPTWYRIRKTDSLLTDEDYSSASVIIEKDLSKYSLDGQLSIRYTKTEGLLLELTRDGNKSTIIIRNDNSVFLKNGNTGKIVHISNDSLSIGSENKSQQPATVGDDNVIALEKLNDEIKSLSEIISINMKIIGVAAKASPYTRLLVAPIKKYELEVKEKIKAIHKINDSFFPETLSEFVTVDKT